jgi:hypothetical protein
MVVAVGYLFAQDNDKGRLLSFHDILFTSFKCGVLGLALLALLTLYRVLIRAQDALDQQKRMGRLVFWAFILVGLTGACYFVGRNQGEKSAMDHLSKSGWVDPGETAKRKQEAAAAALYEEDLQIAHQRYMRRISEDPVSLPPSPSVLPTAGASTRPSSGPVGPPSGR